MVSKPLAWTQTVPCEGAVSVDANSAMVSKPLAWTARDTRSMVCGKHQLLHSSSARRATTLASLLHIVSDYSDTALVIA